MNYPILSTRITDSTIVSLRDRARQVGEIFGLDKLESTRFITAVSEIGRNAVQFAGGGTAAFSFKTPADPTVQQSIVAVITDSGPGIPDIQDVWAARPNSKGKMPLGLAGAKRMVDVFSVQSPDSGGTIVTLEVYLPRTTRRLTQDDLNERTRELIRRKPKTPLQELEMQNTEMLDTLQELRAREIDLKRADERKNDFLSMLAHELSNPLGTLSMNLELLRKTPEHLIKCCETMARQTQQMGKLINDLMDVSRISQGKVKLEKLEVEVVHVVERSIEMCSSALESKQHTVTFNKHDGNVWIVGDSTRLKQVISNLIHNASRYTPVHGHIDVSVATRAHTVDISIADNGIGISSEMLHEIFEMFVQGDATMKESHGGLGIGLTLVRRLVEQHGGTVTASSEGPGKGSMFVVSLPLVNA